jgi:hypothetical protein
LGSPPIKIELILIKESRSVKDYYGRLQFDRHHL